MFPDNVSSAQSKVRHQFRWRALEVWHLWSLDAPTVAVVWLWSFGNENGRTPSGALGVSLFAATWAVYTLDRLLDAGSKEDRELLQPRHHFHGKHRRVLWPLTAAALLLSLWMLLHAQRGEVRPLLWLTLPFALWFAAAHSAGHRYRLPKELTTALVFTLAVALPTQTGSLRASLVPCVSVFLLFALNTSLIPAWEATLGAGHPSAAWVANHVEWIAAALWVLYLAHASIVTAAAAMSGMLLLALHRRGAILAPNTRRAAADLALLTPLLWAAATPRHAWLHVAVGLCR